MSRRSLFLYFGTLGVVFALCIAFAFRPSLVLGVDGDSLSQSLNGSASLGVEVEPCVEKDDGWECSRSDASGFQTRYDVSVDSWGCWTASRGRGPAAGVGAPSSLDGCISILDH